MYVCMCIICATDVLLLFNAKANISTSIIVVVV